MQESPVINPSGSAQTPRLERWWSGPLGVAVVLALLKLAIHLFTAGRYGYFRDELYFLAGGNHLAWGYVDHAPLVALVAWFGQHVLGGSLLAIRFLPALAGAGKVLLTGAIVAELGGKRFAAFLACLTVLVAPIYLGIDNLMSMNAFEPLFWMGCVWCALRAFNRENSHYWLGFGVLAGMGLMNKHSMLFFGLALVAGLLLTRRRRVFADPWFWLGGLVALVIFLPNLVWEYRHDWATLELLRNVRAEGKNVVLPPLTFMAQQIQILLPLSFPVWAAGVWFFLVDRQGRRHRYLGIAWLVVTILMIVMNGKNYYLVPVYPMLFAGGAVWWERVLARVRSVRWLKVALPAIIAGGGVMFAPLILPVLSVDGFLRWEKTLGMERVKTEVAHVGPLPQYFGDQFGWPEMVAEVARIYHALPPAERTRAMILAGNYGEAGAIDYFGAGYGLPRAVCAHQNYYYWGWRDRTGEVAILLQWSRERAERYFERVTAAGTIGHPWAMREEHYTIWVARGLKMPMPRFWEQIRHWN